MKQNKNQPTINLDQEAELVLNLGTGMEAFTISGDAEVLQPLADEAMAHDKALEARQKSQAVKHTAHIAKTAVAGAMTATEGIRERVRTDVRAKLFDIVYHDTSYQELKARRLAEKRLQHRQRIGLITTDRCAKHERLLKQVQ